MSTTDFFIGAIVVGMVIAIVAFSIRKNPRHAGASRSRAGDTSADPTGAGFMPLWMGGDAASRPGHSHTPGPHAGHGHHGHNCEHGCAHDAGAASDSCAPVDSGGGFDSGGCGDGGGGGGGGGDGGGVGGGGGD